jgi:hypothetical protein
MVLAHDAANAEKMVMPWVMPLASAGNSLLWQAVVK